MYDGMMFLFAVLCVLSAASLVSYALTSRATRQGALLPPGLANLNARIKAWWVMVIAIAIAFMFGKRGVIVLFAFVSFAALREFVTLTHTRRGDHWILLGMFLIIIPAQYWLLWTEWYGLFSIFIPVYCFLAMPTLTAFSGDTSRFLERIAEQQWGIMLSVYCISHVPALLILPIPGFEAKGVLLIAFLIATVQGSDVLQYIWGKLFGQHKVAPLISPSKTWEGLVGGVVSASTDRRAALQADALHALSGGNHGRPRLHDGLFRRARRLRHQARPRRQGLGPHDRRPWRHARPRRLR